MRPVKWRCVLISIIFITISTGVASCGVLLPGRTSPLSDQPSTPVQMSPTMKSTQKFTPPVTATATKTQNLSPTAIFPLLTQTATVTNTNPLTQTQYSGKNSDITSDLLYLSEGKLVRWDYVTGYSASLVDDVHEYSVDQSGKKVALLRPLNITANGVDLYNLDLLDFETKIIHTVLEKTSHPSEIRISPDGEWIAYRSSDSTPRIMAIRTGNNQTPIEIGECHQFEDFSCQELVWSPDSQTLLWNDAQGLWSTAINLGLHKQVHPGRIQVSDPAGKSTDINVTLSALSWSPAGRYLLVRVTPNASDVKWYAVIDTPTGRLVQVPETYEHLIPIASVAWMNDGNLLVALASKPEQDIKPVVQVWRIISTREDLFVHEKTFQFQTDSELGLETNNKFDKPIACLNWPSHNSDNLLMLAIHSTDEKALPRLVSLDIVEGVFTQVSEIPIQISQILWSPDGNGALVLGSEKQLLFISFSGSPSLATNPKFGKDAHGFIWLPPTPRY